MWLQWQRKCRWTQIGTRGHGHPCPVQDVCQQSGGGGFAVGAGDADEPGARARRCAPPGIAVRRPTEPARPLRWRAALPDAASAAGVECLATRPGRRSRRGPGQDPAGPNRRCAPGLPDRHPRQSPLRPSPAGCSPPARRSCPSRRRRSVCRRKRWRSKVLIGSSRSPDRPTPGSSI